MPRDPDESWWWHPRVLGGIVAVAVAVGVGLISFARGGNAGFLATAVLLLTAVPIALGAVVAWRLRKKPPRDAQGTGSPQVTG